VGGKGRVKGRGRGKRREHRGGKGRHEGEQRGMKGRTAKWESNPVKCRLKWKTHIKFSLSSNGKTVFYK